MDIKTRLIRKPMTTALWVILVTAMALFLSVGCALMYSSGSLAGILDKYHTSIAVRTDRGVTRTPTEDGVRYSFEDKTLYLNQLEYLEGLDSVEGVYFHTLTGAYCPQLTPLMGTGHMINESYDEVVVIGTINRMTEPVFTEEYMDLSSAGGSEYGQYCYVTAEVKIEEFVYGSDDFTRVGTAMYDGYFNINIEGYGAELMEFLEVGGRYIFYGEYDLSHQYWADGLEDSGHPWLTIMGNQYLDGNSVYNYNSWTTKIKPNGVEALADALITGPHIARIDGTVEEFLAMQENDRWQRILDGQDIAHHALPVLGTEALDTMYIFVRNNAHMAAGRFFTQEEYDSGARVCVLNETLAMESGIGVGDTITLSQYICHNYGEHETNYSTRTSNTDGMLNNPTVGEYQLDNEFLTENEEFTVVGLYRLQNEWSDSSYSITPNTIFIPQKAQPAGGFGGLASSVEITHRKLDGTTETFTGINEGASFGVYMTIKLKNGKVADFEEEIAASELAGEFLTIDQGFGKIQESLNAISTTAMKLLALICGGWLLLLLLYVLLYQAGQRNNLGIMRSLGASPNTVRDYLFRSGMNVAAIGVTLGTVLTGAVLNVVQNKLFESTFGTSVSEYSNSVLTEDAINQMVTGSQLPIWAILSIAAAQLAIFAAVLWLQADKLSKQSPRSLLGK